MIPLLPCRIHHIQRNNGRDADFKQLGGQIQVPFHVGRIYQIDNHVRLPVCQIIPRNNLLRRIRRKRIYARQVHNMYIRVCVVFALLLFDRHPGPVPHILRRTGQRIKDCRFPAVWIACERKTNWHCQFPFLLVSLCKLMLKNFWPVRPISFLHPLSAGKAHSHVP